MTGYMKKPLAWILSAAMLVSATPVNIYAQEAEEIIEEESVVSESYTDNAQSEAAVSDETADGYEIVEEIVSEDVGTDADESCFAESDGMYAEEFSEEEVYELVSGDVISKDMSDGERIRVFSAGTSETDDGYELLNMYLERQLTDALTGSETNDSVSADENAESRIATGKLSANAVELYRFLADKIQKVAAGGIVSTAFELPLNSNEITPDEIKAVTECLMMDYPYDLYWYDKSAGYELTMDSGEYIDEPEFFTYTINMYVACEYSATKAAETTDIDAEAINAVNNTVPAAQAVVAAAVEAGCDTDYKKLCYYRNWICENADYNTDAVMNLDTVYGNPWQLIWVFDNDPATKVVCEGYSKAFKLLCDLTSFASVYTGAYLVNGTMRGGTGAGTHMWNTMRMDDGNYYLVDVANYDMNPAGRASLFLGTYNKELSTGGIYVYDVDDNKTIEFRYNDDLASFYDAQELTMSGKAYDPAGTAVPNPDTEGEMRALTYEPYGEMSVKYTGEPQTLPELKIYAVIATINDPSLPPQMHRYNYRRILLKPVTDYTITYENNIEISTEGNPAKAKVNGAGKFAGFDPVEIPFTILPASEDPGEECIEENGPDIQMKKVAIEGVPSKTEAFAGKKVVLNEYRLTYEGKPLKEGVNYSVSYSKNDRAGKAKIKFTGLGRVKGSVTKTFTIPKGTVTDVSFTSGETTYAYAKGGSKPAVTVKCGDYVLTSKEYTVKYAKNTKTGNEATATVKAKGSFTGGNTLTFSISQAPQTAVEVVPDDLVYSSKSKTTTKIALYDKNSGKKLSAGTDYNKTFIYTYAEDTQVLAGKNKEVTDRKAGEAVAAGDILPAGCSIKVETDLKGNYTGHVTGEYRVVQALLSKATVKVPTVYWNEKYAEEGFAFSEKDIVITLNGSIVTPVTKIRTGGEQISVPNYEIVEGSFTGNKGPGKASFKVRGLGNYGNTKTVNFTILDPNKDKNFVVTFNPNGATSGSMSDKKIKAGNSAALTKNAFKRKGYTFTGWNTLSDGSGTAYADQATFNAPDESGTVTMYAQWTVETYTVSYEGLEGAVNSADNPASYTIETIPAGGYLLKDPEWDKNHLFMGWYTDAKRTKSISVIAEGTTGNLTLYADWMVDPRDKIEKPEGEYIDVTTYATEYKSNPKKYEYEEYISERTGYSVSRMINAVPGDGKDDYEAIRSAVTLAGKLYVDSGKTKRQTVYVPEGRYNITINEHRRWGIRLEEGVDLVMDNKAILDLGQVDIKDEYKFVAVADEVDGQIRDVSIRGGQLWGERYKSESIASRKHAYDAHGLNIQGATNVIISDMIIKDNWGDGICITTKPENGQYYGCKNVLIKNCLVTNNRRNNISIIDVKGLTIDNCTISDANGRSPQCGIIIEPNFERGKDSICKNVLIKNCTVSSYKGDTGESHRAIYTNCDGNDASYYVVDGLRIENCTINGFYGIYTGHNYSDSGNYYKVTPHIAGVVTKGTFTDIADGKPRKDN